MTQNKRLANYRNLKDKIADAQPSREVQTSYASFAVAVEVLNQEPKGQAPFSNALRALVAHFHDAWNSDQGRYTAQLTIVLAEATRIDSLWRSEFGLSVADSGRSILLSTIGAITKSLEQQNYHDCLQPLLKLVANCCADNNVNRKAFLTHNGLQSLIMVATAATEVDILIPTVYNVCSDYEEPPGQGEPVMPVVNAEFTAEDMQPPETSFAITEIGKAHQRHSRTTTFEIFLRMAHLASNDRLEYLAELVELTTIATGDQLKQLTVNSESPPQWCQVRLTHSRDWSILRAAKDMADHDLACRLHLVRAFTNALSEEHACRVLVFNTRDGVWQLMQIAASPISSESNGVSGAEEDVMGDFLEARKHFLKIFYRLTGMPELTSEINQTSSLVANCMRFLRNDMAQATLGSNRDRASEMQHRFFKICCLIILAQSSASDNLREKLLTDVEIGRVLASALADTDQDVLYPAVTCTARLSTSQRSELPFLSLELLHSMQPLLSRPAQGLIIPFETVIAYKTVLRGRPNLLSLLLKDPALAVSNDSHPTTDRLCSIPEALFSLYDRTIELATKVEIALFFIEILRTSFPITKDMDQRNLGDTISDGGNPEVLNATYIQIEIIFRKFLILNASKIVETCIFTCVAAEPASQRVHGWFGMAMLSVYKAGRAALAEAIDEQQSGLSGAIMEVADHASDDGPAQKNLKLLVGQMQNFLSESTRADENSRLKNFLELAAQKLGMKS